MLVFHRAFFNHYPRSTPPITAATSANAQALRLSGCVNSTNEGVDHRLLECFGIRTQSMCAAQRG